MRNSTQIVISAGRPVLKKAGVATHVIMRSFMMGESMGVLAAEFGVNMNHIEQAIRYELALKHSPRLARELLNGGGR